MHEIQRGNPARSWRVSATPFVAAVASVLFASGCSKSDGTAVAPRPAAPPSAAPPLPAAASTDGTEVACGSRKCVAFVDGASAFRSVLHRNPRVVGIGEAHALAGTEGVESATRRFTRDLLPLLEGKATDLVVEVLLPNPGCRAASSAARKEQKIVTDQQAPTDQNEFVALGNAARAMGIRPFALEPTCDDLARIARGGAEAVAASLEAITRLSTEKLSALVKERGDAGTIVLYGGAMHNDAAPAKGREPWSYGPAAAQAAGPRGYVEVDLIVPEYVKRTPAWESLPWFKDYDPTAHPEHALVFGLAERSSSFVIVFPASRSQPAPKRPAPPSRDG